MADTDNKVDEATEIDTPRLKHEVEEIIEREEAASREEEPEPAITSEETTATEEPEGPSLQELQDRLANIEQRYSASSAEGKRLAEELRQYQQREEFLRNRWNIDELYDGYQHQPPPEERPITRRELEILQEQQRWKSAEETFFTRADNKDLNNKVMKKAVIALLFNDDGSLAFPDKTPIESFHAAAKEVRKIIAGERQRGKEEIMKTRTEMEKAALASGTATAPESATEEEDIPDENEYVNIWREHRKKTTGGW